MSWVGVGRAGDGECRLVPGDERRRRWRVGRWVMGDKWAGDGGGDDGGGAIGRAVMMAMVIDDDDGDKVR